MQVSFRSNGAISVSSLVTNGYDTWLESRTYYGDTSPAEAQALFRSSVLSMGWRLGK